MALSTARDSAVGATTQRRQSTAAYAPVEPKLDNQRNMEAEAQTARAAAASCEPLEAAQRRVRQLKAAQRAKEDAHALAVVLPVIRELEAAGIRGDNRAIAQALNDRGVRTAYGSKWYGQAIRRATQAIAAGRQTVNQYVVSLPSP